MNENDISKIIVEEAIYLHRSIGPGMLESVYEHCLIYRLIKRGLSVKSQVAVPLIFEEVKLECGYRADIVVEDKVIIEIKRVDSIAPVHIAQTLTYLQFLKLKLALVLNFNCYSMKEGIRRVVKGLQ